MKKLVTALKLMVLVLISSFAFASCSSDDGDGLSGLYISNRSFNGFHAILYIINSNTMEYYSSASNGPTSGTDGLIPYKSRIRNTSWYCYDSADGTYTYTKSENKMIVPMAGWIITISGNQLIIDGGETYTKQ